LGKTALNGITRIDFWGTILNRKISEIREIRGKKRELAYDEAKDYRVGGEDDSSRAHSVPDGDYDDQLYGKRTVLNEE